MMSISSESDVTSIWRETSHGNEYTIESTKKRVRRPAQQAQCNLVSVDTMIIPCFACTPFNDFDNYLDHYEELLSSSVLSQHLPPCCADRIALDFTRHVLEPANAQHRCATLFYTSTYFVQIWLQPGIDSDAYYSPHTEPASRSYVSDLIASKGDGYERDWNCTEHECSICIDDIDKPRDSLTLPCSHMFHQACLLRWLDSNHVCPLCRFEMPTDIQS